MYASIRKRFWKGEMSADKKAAYETLYECLMVTAQLMSPVGSILRRVAL
jgi:isoleucyl-tRNA synthetase